MLQFLIIRLINGNSIDPFKVIKQKFECLYSYINDYMVYISMPEKVNLAGWLHSKIASYKILSTTKYSKYCIYVFVIFSFTVNYREIKFKLLKLSNNRLSKELII
jgi:hypothetical protein